MDKKVPHLLLHLGAVLLAVVCIFFTATPAAFAATISFGTGQEFNSVGLGSISTNIDSTHVLVVYANPDTGDKTAVIETISGNSISLGTPAVVGSVNISVEGAAALDSTHIIIGYDDGSGNGTAVVGSISGTTISFGTPAAFSSDTSTGGINFAVLNSSHAVIGYSNSAAHGLAVVAAISGTTLSYGSPVTVFSADIGAAPLVAPIDSTHAFVGYEVLNGVGGFGEVATISGTAISQGSATKFSTNIQSIKAVNILNSTHATIVYSDSDLASNFAIIVAVISGTSVSFGSPVLLSDPSGTVTANTAGSNLVLAYRQAGGNNFGVATVGTLSGSTISFGDIAQFDSAVNFTPRTITVAQLDSTHVVVSYYDNNTGHGFSAVGTVTSNAAPTFSSVSNTSGYVKAGSAITFTSTASDPDSGDTVTLYVCKANDFTGSACGAGGTWCSSSALTTNPSCSYTVQSSDGDGSHTYYANIADNSNLASSSNPRSSTFSTDTTAPTVNAGLDQTRSAQFTPVSSASDATSGIASYQWSQVSGSGTITFGTSTALTTTVSANTNGTYVARLTVTDVAGNSSHADFTLVWTSGTSGGGGGGSVAVFLPPSDQATIQQLQEKVISLMMQIIQVLQQKIMVLMRQKGL